MLRIDDETHTRIVKVRGELERRSGKARTLTETVALMAEASAICLGVIDTAPSSQKAVQAHQSNKKAFREVVNYAGTVHLKNAVRTLLDEPGTGKGVL